MSENRSRGADVYVHPQGLVESTQVGPGSRVWAFAHILPRARIGCDANICDHVFIENDVVVGDRVTVKSGVQLWDGLRVEDDVFIGPNATFTNDRFPRSKNRSAQLDNIHLGKGCSVGASATVLAGVTVGQHAMIGAGAVVIHDVPPFAVVAGNPAQIIGYVDTDVPPLSPAVQDVATGEPLSVPNVRFISLPAVKDLRGMLVFGEVDQHLPFPPRRFFVIFEVPSREVRGGHAHHELQEVIVCLRGAVSVVVDDGEHRTQVTLDAPQRALYVPAMIWRTLYGYSPDALVLVLASAEYDANDYIRSYDTFLGSVGKGP